MFDKKYRKALKILDEELETIRHSFSLCVNREYPHIKDPEVLDYLISENHRLMDSNLDRLGLLIRLRDRFKSEIGE